MFRRCTPFQTKECMEWTNQSQDWVFMSATRLDQRQPLYKPEHWDKMIELDQWTNKYDPVMTCLPLGIPRQGPPARIFHTDNDITMIYRGGVDGAGGYAEFRMIPLDGRPHLPGSFRHYMGDARGRWDGTTLVIETTNFTDKTPYRGSSDQLKLVERFTPLGPDTVEWAVTFEDAHTWARPWTFAMNLTHDASQPPFEYACHEGNYGLRNILAAARAEERAAAGK